MEVAPLVYISVLNWNNYRDTINCVKSILLQDYTNYRLFLVDNKSVNESVSVLQTEFPEVSLIVNKENLGYAGGHHAVSDLAVKNGAELLLLLNNDSVIYSDTLTELVGAYQKNGDNLYGSVILDTDAGVEKISYPDRLKKDVNEVVQKDQIDVADLKNFQPTEVDYVEGSCLCIPVSVIKKYGFMDTRFFLYFEEYDYCKRLQHKDVKSLIIPGSKILHRRSGSFKQSNNLLLVREYYFNRNWVFFRRKYHHYSLNGLFFAYGGKWKLFKKWMLLPFSKKDKEYYFYLAILHGIMNIRGKVVSPEDFLEGSV